MAPPPAAPPAGPALDEALVALFERKGFRDESITRIIFDHTAPHLVTPAEREFSEKIRRVLLDDASVTLYPLDGDFPKFDMPAAERRKIMAQFAMMNVYKAARFLGLKWGPDFIEHIGFPIWRPSFWNSPKVEKFVSYVGVAPAEHGNTWHPYDLVLSSRYHNCIMIRETPVPDVHAGEDYVAHHEHGLHTLARLMSLSFIDIDAEKRTFRFYCVQGCSRLYHWDELDDPDVAAAVRTKIMVKGRVPRTKDFDLVLRDGWSASGAHAHVAEAQRRILAALPLLRPLLPIKMLASELVPRCIIDIAPIVVAQFLDGRSGMSYGFLAYQLPTGPVEACRKVSVLVTRSGCDKQKPDLDRDWIVLSFDPEAVELEVSKAMRDITSPSFDSWLILGQAATNVGLARKFKAAGRSRRYVRMVENDGVALCHFHGFIPRAALPPNVAFFGQDRLPLPCGSIESALLTIEEKGAIGDRVVSLDFDLDYAGDVHVEPDHGCVVSTDFGTLERLAKDAAFGLKHYATYKCGSSACAHGACNGNGAAKAARKAAAGKAAGGKGAWPKAAYERWCPEAAKPEA